MGGWEGDRQSAEAATQIGQRDIFGRRRAENYWGENESRRRGGEKGRIGIEGGGEENEFPLGLISDKGDVSGNYTAKWNLKVMHHASCNTAHHVKT